MAKKSLSIAVSVAVLSAHAAAQSAHWSRLPDLPAPISNNAATSILHDDGTATLYTFMGITDPNNTDSITPAAYKLTIPGDETWTRIADVPLWNGRARIAASAVTVASHIYLLGGYTVNDDHTETTDPRLLRYEQGSNTWAELSRPPVEVDDTVALVYANRFIILCSGWHGPALNNTLAVQIYDTQADTWTRLNDMPGPATGLFGHAGGISGNTILIADGVTTLGGYKISPQLRLGNIITDSGGSPQSIDWSDAPPHPGRLTYRAAFASADADNETIFIVGGTDNPYNINGIGYDKQPSPPLTQVLMYDVSNKEWTIADSAGDHTPTMDHRAMVPISNDGTRWAIIGGMTQPGRATSLVQILRIEGIE